SRQRRACQCNENRHVLVLPKGKPHPDAPKETEEYAHCNGERPEAREMRRPGLDAETPEKAIGRRRDRMCADPLLAQVLHQMRDLFFVGHGSPPSARSVMPR